MELNCSVGRREIDGARLGDQNVPNSCISCRIHRYLLNCSSTKAPKAVERVIEVPWQE